VVHIVADNDLAGFLRARRIALDLKSAGIPVKVWRSKTDGKGDDIVEHFAAGGTYEDLRPLRKSEIDAAETEGKSAGDDSLTGWELSDLTPYLDGTYQAEQPTVGRREDGTCLFYKGRVNGLHGPSEGGKSWVALVVCMQEIKAGHSVLYIDYEDTEGGVASRLLELGCAPGEVLERFRYISPEARISEAAKAMLEPIVSLMTLVVIDAATESLAAEGLSSNQDVEIADFYALLPRWVARQGPAVVLIDHSPKDAETHGNGQTGSQHKRSAMQGASYLVEPVRRLAKGRADGTSRLRVSKDRPGGVREHSIPNPHGLELFADFTLDASDPEALDASLTMQLALDVSDNGDVKAAEVKSKMTRALRDAREPLSKTKLLKATRALGAKFDDGDAAAWLDQLVEGGYLNHSKGARSSDLYSFVKPFTVVEVATEDDVDNEDSS
jgi:hypothetical protein